MKKIILRKFTISSTYREKRKHHLPLQSTRTI